MNGSKYVIATMYFSHYSLFAILVGLLFGIDMLERAPQPPLASYTKS